MYRPSLAFINKVLPDFNIVLAKTLTFSASQGHLTNDSRNISQGDIFCAVIGQAQDGRQYINTAITKGAALILSECEDEAEHGKMTSVANASKGSNEQVIVISFYQLNKKLFALASAYYQAPQQKMTMIGITGTNGKTSTSQLLGQILTQCNRRCAIIGTNGAGIVENEGIETLTELANTTPSATDLVQLFADFADKAVSHLAMEVSSHALEQGRVSAEIFDIAVFTNLSRDHLDYHGTMADYAAAKRLLFTHHNAQVAILNADDTCVQAWLKSWPTPENLWLYGRSEQVQQHHSFVSCHSVKHHSLGVTFMLTSHLGDIEIHSSLLGDFNIDNLLAVISVLLSIGCSLTEIANQVAGVKAIAGRMESFSATDNLHKAPTAVVDYAHTPDALEKALLACRQHCHGQLFVVFGCGGDRDKGKRPLMAQAAEKYADCLVITSDNPRTESPMSIIEDVLAGIENKAVVSVIEDRKDAVLATLAKAKANDVVLLAGKGHENYIIIGTEKVDYNERQVVQDFFELQESKQYDTGQATVLAGRQS